MLFPKLRGQFDYKKSNKFTSLVDANDNDKCQFMLGFTQNSLKKFETRNFYGEMSLEHEKTPDGIIVLVYGRYIDAPVRSNSAKNRPDIAVELISYPLKPYINSFQVNRDTTKWNYELEQHVLVAKLSTL